MNIQTWSERADYLKKRYDYARHVGSAQTEAWRLNLLSHLEAEPDSDTTPLPEITEPSTVEKFGDGWIEWQYGSSVIPPYGCKVEVRTRRGSTIEGISGKFGWKPMGEISDIIAYRVVKD
jgi:hypothetical protein